MVTDTHLLMTLHVTAHKHIPSSRLGVSVGISVPPGFHGPHPLEHRADLLASAPPPLISLSLPPTSTFPLALAIEWSSYSCTQDRPGQQEPLRTQFEMTAEYRPFIFSPVRRYQLSAGGVLPAA